jgi:Type II secretory pathway, pullulanase PulA and related glycosidases
MIALRYGVRGITKTATVTIADPDKTVNYVSCHDNYTLVDRFGITGQTYTSDQLEKMNVLANAVTFTSQGTTFMDKSAI